MTATTYTRTNLALVALRRHVSGAVARGAQPVTEIPAQPDLPIRATLLDAGFRVTDLPSIWQRRSADGEIVEEIHLYRLVGAHSATPAAVHTWSELDNPKGAREGRHIVPTTVEAVLRALTDTHSDAPVLLEQRL